MARFLRVNARTSPHSGGGSEEVRNRDELVDGPEQLRFKRRKPLEADEPGASVDDSSIVQGRGFPFEVVFGLPWDYEGFIKKACQVGHPGSKSTAVPWEVEAAIDKCAEWSKEQMSAYRITWCRG